MAALAAQIAPKRARMEAIMRGAEDDGGRELNASEAEEFDGLAEDVQGLETKLRRVKALDASLVTARAIEPGDRPRPTVPATPRPTAEKGIGFARMVMCFAAAKGNRFEAIEIAKSRYPHEKGIPLVLKAPVSGGTTLESEWASSLVDPTNLVGEFIEFLRPQTIVGRFGAGNVPGLRRVPFNVRIQGQIGGGAADWVGEGKAKPVTKFGYEPTILRWTKIAAIAVLSEDLLRFSTPSAEMLVRDSLRDVIVERMDDDFIDPAISLIADVRPASITNGAATSAASGIDAAAVRADIKTAVTAFITANIAVTGLVIVMRSSQALALSLMRNTLGQREFPDMTVAGGMLEGIPVVASQYVPQGVVAFVSAENIFLADDGGVSIDMSREASLQMDDHPTMAAGDSVGSPYTPTATSVVSMFQTNSVAIRAERFVNWARRRTAAVYYLTSVGWGNDDTSPPQAAI